MISHYKRACSIQNVSSARFPTATSLAFCDGQIKSTMNATMHQTRRTLSCLHPNWEDDVLYLLSTDHEIDLIDFDYDKHGTTCESLARQYPVELRMDRNPSVRVIYFRRTLTTKRPRNDK